MKIFLLNLVAVVMLGVVFAGWLSQRAVDQAAQLEFTAAAQSVKLARPVPAFLNTLTLGLLPDLAWWNAQLAAAGPLLETADEIAAQWQQSFAGQESAATDAAGLADSNLHTELPAAIDLLETSQQHYTQTLLIQRLVPERQARLPLFLSEALSALAGEHSVIVLLQNNQELRATGGFMGSYARLDMTDGGLAALKLEDIYQPAGQLIQPRPAPAGVREYLSGGRGLRLQDSNWHPDFPSAGPVILELFAAGNETGVTTLAAVNLRLLEQLLDQVGGLYLPDFGVTVTSDNLASVARADREQFFPGSKQKAQFLSVLANQLKFRLAELEPDQRQELFELLVTAIDHQNLMVYSEDARLQNLVEELGATGAVATDPCSRHWQRLGDVVDIADCAQPSYFLSLVESNVGANKANRGVERQVTIDASVPGEAIITLQFSNDNPAVLQPATDTRPAERGDYINYQRLLVPLSTQVTAITVDGQPLETWDESELPISQAGETSPQADRLKQVGWLAPVPAGQTATVQISLQLAQPAAESLAQLLIGKQPGLPPTTYTVTTTDASRSFTLNRGTVVSLIE